MLFSAMVIILMTLVFLLLNQRNRINLALSLYYISVAVIMVAAVLYISKTYFYNVSLDIDYSFYKFLTKLRCPFDMVIRLFNIGMGIFMVANVASTCMFYKVKRYIILLALLPMTAYVFLNSPSFSWRLYVYINTSKTMFGSVVRENMAGLLGELGRIIILSYMILPFLCIGIYALRTKIRRNRNHALTYGALIFCMDVYLYAYFINGKFFENLVSVSGLIKFPDETGMLPSYSFSGMFILLVLAMIILISFKYKPLNSLTLVSTKETARMSRAVDKNFRMLLHIYKNSFVGIEKLAYMGGEYLKENNLEKSGELYGQIGQICGESVGNISRVLDLLRDVDVEFEPFGLYGCIDEALAKTVPGRNISVTKNYNAENDIVAGDKTHITEVFVNLFINAAEACAGKDECRIEIASFRENNLIIIEITDNGCGIESKDLKKIFKPFYSTKKRSECGGIGLSYVERIVEQQHGGIAVRSEKDKYTTFQLYFPTVNVKTKGRK